MAGRGGDIDQRKTDDGFMRRNIMVVMLMAACGGGSDGAEAPTCQVAVAHYYGAGCKFVDLQTGADISQNDWLLTCRAFVSEAPPSCVDDVEQFRICMNSVPSPAMNNADCDCSAEQEALLTCE